MSLKYDIHYCIPTPILCGHSTILSQPFGGLTHLIFHLDSFRYTHLICTTGIERTGVEDRAKDQA